MGPDQLLVAQFEAVVGESTREVELADLVRLHLVVGHSAMRLRTGPAAMRQGEDC